MLGRYIEALDAETPDADLEPSLGGFGGMAGSRDEREADYPGHTSDDEPLQGWTEAQTRVGRFGGGYAMDDDEHSLGSINGTAGIDLRWSTGGRRWRSRVVGASQVHWARGAGNDLEAAHDGREPQCEDEGAPTGDDEPDADGEPMMGSVEQRGPGNQVAWAAGAHVLDECEDVSEDEGAQCDDGEMPWESDAEPDLEGEPILGACEGGSGGSHSWHGCSDGELNGDEGDYSEGVAE